MNRRDVFKATLAVGAAIALPKLSELIDDGPVVDLEEASYNYARASFNDRDLEYQYRVEVTAKSGKKTTFYTRESQIQIPAEAFDGGDSVILYAIAQAVPL